MKKADNVHRAIAKAVDFLIVGILSTVPSLVGVLAGALYILISDGFFEGQSVGKKLVGLRVYTGMKRGTPTSCTFRESMVRNLPYGVVFVLGSIPFLGWVLFFTVGLGVIGMEAYFAYSDDQGIRMGDIFADTHVVDAKKNS